MECGKDTESCFIPTLMTTLLVLFCTVIADPVSFNIIGKDTWQSSNFRSNRDLSSAAVDGCKIFTLSANCCTHTHRDSGHGWWSVDLQQTVILNSVTVFNRDSSRERLSQFTIFGSNTSHEPTADLTQCAERDEFIYAQMKLTCMSPVMARYVSVVKKQNSDDPILTLCEVEIEVCPANTYGQQCKPCGHCQNPQCDWTSETGVCFGGCTAGYAGNNCQTKCDGNTYGIDCQPCSENCRNSTCDKFSETMDCSDGCIAGKTGRNCSQDCPEKTYGYDCLNCSKKCIESKCVTSSITMKCSNGCIAGYMGSDCSAECPNNTYGVGCKPCSSECFQSRCHRFSDTINCTDGCVPGYQGIDCATECPNNTYGIGCQPCSSECFQSRCHKFSETLNCTDGCIPGYRGIDCSAECPNGTYGYGCLTCSKHCVNSLCDKFSEYGVCLDGCETGYTAENCTEECPNGTYGLGCLPCSKHCVNSLCDKFSEYGACLDGCEAGYTTENCTEECPNGTYGFGCLPCSEHCVNSLCEKFSEYGVCSDGCEVGYTKGNCTKECPDNTYGSACHPCSPNCKTPPCNKFSENGVCTTGCVTGYSGEACFEYQQNEGDEGGNNYGVTAGVVVAIVLIAIIVVVILVVLFRRKNHKRAKTEEGLDLGEAANIRSVPNDGIDVKTGTVENCYILPKLSHTPGGIKSQTSNANKEVTLDADQVFIAFQDNGNEYVNVGETVTPQSPTHIMVKDLRQHVETTSFGSNIKDEYEDIPQTTASITEANKPELKSKNRYKNIVPYNHNRVLLEVQDEDHLTDYINASFIEDYHGKVSYIAALGSTKTTLPDTWRMIWEHEIKSIFMVTNLTEAEKIKCEQYWPSDGLQRFGQITVMLKEETMDPHIIIRKLRITKAEEHRFVTQYHYTSWPDKQPPLSVTSVLKLRTFLKEERLRDSTPVLVHCSAGIGRTGTLIALDILLDQIDAEGAVDIKKCVEKLRHQRVQMVQSLVQYKFLYHCVNEISTLGSTVVTIDGLSIFLNSCEFMERTQMEYQFLENIKPVFTEEETEMGRIDFSDKNRDSNVIPDMQQRVKLSLLPEIYINAVYVRGYEGPQEFCATQWPLENTAGDFWKVILQEKSAAIVCMQCRIDDDMWFSDKNLSVTYDDITVSATCTSDDTETQQYDIFIQQHEANDSEYANVSSVNEANIHQLKMIVVKFWPSLEAEERNSSLILATYRQVQAIAQTAKQNGVTVTCRNGANETGLYIGASILFDMIKKEQQVDVVQVVKQIRKTRPQFIISQEQYRWLYTVSAAYLADRE